jgi:hypothetical protein
LLLYITHHQSSYHSLSTLFILEVIDLTLKLVEIEKTVALTLALARRWRRLLLPTKGVGA